MRTKRIIGLMAAAIVAMCMMSAQAYLRYGVTFGGSVATPQLSDAPGWTITHGSGFRGGLMLEYQWEEKGWAVSGAVLYNRYNAKLKGAGTELQQPVCHAIGRDFLDIPLHAAYKFWIGQTRLWGPMVYTGPALTVGLNSAGHCPVFTQRRAQAGWDVGVGIDAVNFLQIKAGYRFGLTNAAGDFAGHPDASMRFSGWHVSASLLFQF